MPEAMIQPQDLKALTAAQARMADEMAKTREEIAQTRAVVKQIADDAPKQANDFADHGAWITVGLMILYFVLSGALEWVKKTLHDRGQKP